MLWGSTPKIEGGGKLWQRKKLSGDADSVRTSASAIVTAESGEALQSFPESGEQGQASTLLRRPLLGGRLHPERGMEMDERALRSRPFPGTPASWGFSASHIPAASGGSPSISSADCRISLVTLRCRSSVNLRSSSSTILVSHFSGRKLKEEGKWTDLMTCQWSWTWGHNE